MQADKRALLRMLLGGVLLGGYPTWARAADPTPAQLKEQLRKLRKETLDRLYAHEPGLRVKVRGSAGYGVFAVEGVQILFVGGSGGRGIVRDNLTGRDTYMRMGSLSAGLGVGYRDLRLVLVFKKRDALTRFVTEGWTLGGEGAAAAKSGAQGSGTVGMEFPEGIEAYPLVETGLMFKVSLQGARYWVDETLSGRK